MDHNETPKKTNKLLTWRWITGVLALLMGFVFTPLKPLNGIAFLLLSIVLIPPLFIWAQNITNKHPSRRMKIALVVVLSLFAILGLGKTDGTRIANDSAPTSTSVPTNAEPTSVISPSSVISPTQVPTNTPVVTKKPEPTKVPTRKAKIDVTSQIVKKVGDKHRYLFDIRNNDVVPFEGDVSIVLYNTEGDDLGADTFSTKTPIEPGLGDSVYFDIYTGPPSVHGANGISTYTYKVTSHNRVINEGKGTISDDYEDLSE